MQTRGDDNEAAIESPWSGDEWDAHVDQHVHALGTHAVKFTRADRQDPDAVVQLSLGSDLGLYLGARSWKRRVDSVAPGKPGALAVYGPDRAGTVVPVDWAHIGADPDTNASVLHVDATVTAEDLCLPEHGSVGAALAALKQETARLAAALTASQDQVRHLTETLESVGRIHVEHESQASAQVWSFATAIGDDGVGTFTIRGNGQQSTTYRARPAAEPASAPQQQEEQQQHHEDAAPPADGVLDVSDAVDQIPVVPTAAIDAAAPAAAATEQESISVVPTEPVAAIGNDGGGGGDGAPSEPLVADAPPPPHPDAAAESAHEAPAVEQQQQQQRRAKTARGKSRATASEAPGSPPPAARGGDTPRGPKTRQSARRASASSSSLFAVDSAGAAARPHADQ